jgi:hypothetical protein
MGILPARMRTPLQLALFATCALSLAACEKGFEEADANPSNGGSGATAGTGAAPSAGGTGAGGSGGSSGAAAAAGDGGDSGTVSPPEIPTEGMLLWLRADEGVTEANGSVVEWADQSGNNSNASQAVTNLQPIRVGAGAAGAVAISFDGVDDFLDLPTGFADFTQGTTMFAVYRNLSPLSGTAILELSNGQEIDDMSLGMWDGLNHYEIAEGWIPGAEVPEAVPALVRMVQDAQGFVELSMNGTHAGDGSLGVPKLILRNENFIGRSLYGSATGFPGEIAEIIVYARVASDEEILQIEAYLQERWGCCVN